MSASLDLLITHSDRRAIVITHWLMNTGNPGSFSDQGAAIYNTLKDRPNLFLMLGGHIHGEGQRVDTYNGSTVHSLLADYQSLPNGGNGYLRILEFSPANNEIRVKTYSPYLDTYMQGSTSEFTLSYDMNGTDWIEIGSVAEVPSGANAVLDWNGLEFETQYEWYTSLSDGQYTTTGPIWTFTTASFSAAGDQALPAVTALLSDNPRLFRPGYGLAFDLAQAGRVQLQIYSVDGRVVANLVDASLEAGRHNLVWNGADDAGHGVPTGVYFIHLVAPGCVQSQRLLLMRCPRCSAAMVILAFLSDPPVVAKILRHLRLPTAPPPLAPARGGGGSEAWGGSVMLPLSPDDPVTEVPEHAQACHGPDEGWPDRAPARSPDPATAVTAGAAPGARALGAKPGGGFRLSMGTRAAKAGRSPRHVLARRGQGGVCPRSEIRSPRWVRRETKRSHRHPVTGTAPPQAPSAGLRTPGLSGMRALRSYGFLAPGPVGPDQRVTISRP